MNIIFQINGGIGKCILSTSMLPGIKSIYPNSQLIVMSGYPEVFLNNTLVDRSFAFGQAQYFYQDFIENKEFRVFAHDPYLQTEHLMQNEHLSHTWSRMFGLPIPEDIYPQLFLTDREKQFFSQKFISDKPILLLQTNGGAMQQELKYSWARDIPFDIAQLIVKNYSEQYHIFQVTRPDSQKLEGVEVIDRPLSNMELFAILAEAQKRVLIDSCLQHAAAAFKLPSTVLWIGTSPNVFGYNIHKNIIANPPNNNLKLIDSYMFDYALDGILHECPYIDSVEMFNMDDIFNNI